MKKDIKPIPEFENEDEERKFWATHSAVDYFDISTAYRPTEPFLNLKPSEDLLELQLPMDEIKNLESLAKKNHVTRNALASRILREGIRREQAQVRP